MTYVIQAFTLTALAVVLASPALFLAWKRERPVVFRRFSVGAVSLGVAGALVRLSSDVLVDRCRSAGNTGCLDIGSVGFQVFLFSVYTLVGLAAAYRLLRS